jgi:hypothetical protein
MWRKLLSNEQKSMKQNIVTQKDKNVVEKLPKSIQ